MSEANILVSEASKLSAGARIFRGPKGPEILEANIIVDTTKSYAIGVCNLDGVALWTRSKNKKPNHTLHVR